MQLIAKSARRADDPDHKLRDVGGNPDQNPKDFASAEGKFYYCKIWVKADGGRVMERINVYWKPVYNILEEDFEVPLVNARYMKNAPGHKTDNADSSWLTKLLLSGY